MWQRKSFNAEVQTSKSLKKKDVIIENLLFDINAYFFMHFLRYPLIT